MNTCGNQTEIMSSRDYRCEYVLVDTSVWGQDCFNIQSLQLVHRDSPNCEVEFMLAFNQIGIEGQL